MLVLHVFPPAFLALQDHRTDFATDRGLRVVFRSQVVLQPPRRGEDVPAVVAGPALDLLVVLQLAHLPEVAHVQYPRDRVPVEPEQHPQSSKSVACGVEQPQGSVPLSDGCCSALRAQDGRDPAVFPYAVCPPEVKVAGREEVDHEGGLMERPGVPVLPGERHGRRVVHGEAELEDFVEGRMVGLVDLERGSGLLS